MPPSDRSLRALTALVGVLVAIMGGWLLYVSRGILLPLVIAMLLCTMLQPLVRALNRLFIPYWVTVIALVTGLFLGIARGALFLRNSLGSFFNIEVGGTLDPGPLSNTPDTGIGDWGTFVNGVDARLHTYEFPKIVQIAVDNGVTYLRELDPGEMVRPFLAAGQQFIGSLLLVIVYMLFIFAEQAVFRSKILAVAGDRGEDAARVLSAITRGIQSYLGVKTVISLLTGVLCFIALQFLQVPLAPLFGLIAFLLNYIPVFGSIVAGLFPAALALATTETLTTPLLVIAVYVVVNIVMAYLLEPKLFGRELNLSPLIILVSVLVWTALWGIPGTFLSVPLTATLQIVLANVPSTRPVALMLSSGATVRERTPSPPHALDEDELA